MLPFSEIDNSVTIIIGPEGGFELSEVESFEKMGFECCSLGKRILRAETVAMFIILMAMSLRLTNLMKLLQCL